jgi:ABC-type polysaccharide/polyol phosphate export permease
VLVAPIPRLAIVLGKLCGGSVLAVLQAGLFLLLAVALGSTGLAPDIRIVPSAASTLGTVLFLLLVSFALTALGYCIAWPLDSIQGYHAVMSVVLMPMWLLSGAFFPAGNSGWLSWVIRLNPLTYGVAGLRRLLYFQSESAPGGGLPTLGVSVAITCSFCLTCILLAVFVTNRRASKDAR